MTNWALRFVYEDEFKSDEDYMIPYKTIVDYKKTGGKKRMGFYGVSLYLSSSFILDIPFDSKKSSRNTFISALFHHLQNIYNFPEKEWSTDKSWLKRLKNQSGYKLIKNDFSPTYPEYMLIPKSIKKETIVTCSQYRSRERIPILTYIYPENKCPLLRSSQPLSGFLKQASKADQEYISALIDGRKLAILDCRPKINAVANQFTGGGYESEENYDNSTFEFLGIPNIHKVRGIYQQLLKSEGFDKWGALILQLISASKIGAEKLLQNISVLVHCSDGWDRTSQVSSLIQILLDPYSRTFKGFRELIQKDWIDTGHMFHLRCCHAPHSKIDEASPIFPQFLDATFQIMNVYPNEFEFNEKLLSFLGFHSYSQLYGDFVINTHKERNKIPRAPSLWSCFDDDNFREKFINNDFKPQVQGMLKDDPEYYELLIQMTGMPIFGGSSILPVYQEIPETPNYPDLGLKKKKRKHTKRKKNGNKTKKITKGNDKKNKKIPEKSNEVENVTNDKEGIDAESDNKSSDHVKIEIKSKKKKKTNVKIKMNKKKPKKIIESDNDSISTKTDNENDKEKETVEAAEEKIETKYSTSTETETETSESDKEIETKNKKTAETAEEKIETKYSTSTETETETSESDKEIEKDDNKSNASESDNDKIKTKSEKPNKVVKSENSETETETSESENEVEAKTEQKAKHNEDKVVKSESSETETETSESEKDIKHIESNLNEIGKENKISDYESSETETETSESEKAVEQKASEKAAELNKTKKVAKYESTETETSEASETERTPEKASDKSEANTETSDSRSDTSESVKSEQSTETDTETQTETDTNTKSGKADNKSDSSSGSYETVVSEYETDTSASESD
ncbi:myotubularin-related protein 8 [Histomonas meleagridis]|uniref:myotubularin-related protein 8 n=1 Tax=Histomonas meleagridis TaxID=135588 RepID=UPI0035596FC5|nr:myotubularin-related protein 8 [Histomonas meleagridis]KAH0804329.1 myotubularin-related protein 8 [Histomonas meleagridis]